MEESTGISNHQKGKEMRHYSHRKWYKITTWITGIICFVSIVYAIHTRSEFGQRSRDVKLTMYLVGEFKNEHMPVNAVSIYRIIRSGKSIVKKYFPNHEFSLNDVLAIGYVESCYDPECVGKAGEVGLFQILRPGESLKRLKMNKEYDFFDVPLNVEMCVEMLKQKYESNGRKDYQATIIAYNGSSTYWPKFIKIKKIVDRASHRLNYEMEL